MGGLSETFGGGLQLDAFQGHWHAATKITTSSSQRCPQPDAYYFGGGNDSTLRISAVNPISDLEHGEPRISSETRPKNYTVKVWRRTA